MKDKFYIEPVESEKKYQRLAKLGAELCVPIPQAFLEIAVTMPDGKLLQHFKQRSHSWNRNAYNVIASNLLGLNANDNTFGAGKLSGKKDTGAVCFGSRAFALSTNRVGAISYNYDIEGATVGYRALVGITDHGILIGTGDDVETFEGYWLTTKIANGTGAGQMNYVASELNVRAYDAGTKTLTNTLLRYFNNNSPALITVKEVALTAISSIDDGGNSAFMVSRDVLAPTVDVPVSGQLKVTYTISMIYPA
jgi:hypothetical protein